MRDTTRGGPSLPGAVTNMMQKPSDLLRRSSIHGIWEKAKKKQVKLERSKWAMLAFEYGVYVLLLLFIYFVLVGRPLWKGLTWYLWYVVIFRGVTVRL